LLSPKLSPEKPDVILTPPSVAAFRVILLVIRSWPFHVADPSGAITVSPGFALETAALTSAKEGLATWITSTNSTEMAKLVLPDPVLLVTVSVIL
jgi:hypothetical protein